MSDLERVIYIQGVGAKPLVQEQLPELWLPYGLSVEQQPVEWTSADYDDRVAEIGTRIIELSAVGNVSIVAASGGVKTQMSLIARYIEHIHRAVSINGKFEPFDFSDSPTQGTRRPNLVRSSDVMQEDYKNISPEKLADISTKLLWIRSRSDETIPHDTVPSVVKEYILPIDGHRQGIEYALTIGGPAIAGYLMDGTVPSSV
ncbi:hypothetical protein KBD20_02910 [Candidatus Saccharibacteria bacterium]|nr:hypothetical protein [Candidatus Saccharibacteria bacterium]